MKPPDNLPTKFELEQNYPNPFSSSTSISYKLADQSNISVKIYNVLGQVIKEFRAGTQGAGIHGIVWDGTNNFGRKVIPGVYFCRLQTYNQTAIRKMMLLANSNENIVFQRASIASPSVENLPGRNLSSVKTTTYTVQVACVFNTVPRIAPIEITGVTVGNDTTINFAADSTGPGGVWTQGVGLDGENWKCGFGAIGGNLVTSTYCPSCSQAAIYLSTDEGLTWKPDTVFHVDNHIVNDSGFINYLYLAAPFTFITDGANLLGGVGDVYRGALYRSTDNGITWSDSGISWPENDTTDHWEDFNCFCLSGDKIFAGTWHGVFVSTDYGMSWNPSNVGIPVIYTGSCPSVTGLASIGDTLFAATSAFGIYRSTNGGTSWVTVDTTDYNFGNLATVGSEVFAAAFYDGVDPETGGVFVSSDGGESWHHADADLPDHGVGAICAIGSYLFAGTDTAIFASSDLGATWMDISIGDSFGGATTTLWTNGNYLFSNSGGSVWRFPLLYLPGMSNTEKVDVLRKLKGK